MRDEYEVGLGKLSSRIVMFLTVESFSVGNRKKMMFWKDRCCEDEPLCILPIIICLSYIKRGLSGGFKGLVK